MAPPLPARPVVLNRDHARPRTCPAPAVPGRRSPPPDLLTARGLRHGARGSPASGLRDRRLGLPVMVAAVLALIWRQIPSVSELGRVLAREGLLWTPPLRVSQQALSLRLRCLPATCSPTSWPSCCPACTPGRPPGPGPVPAVIARAQAHFPAIWAVDGTTLEAVFKKVGLLRGRRGRHGGTVEAVLDLATKLPVPCWLDPDRARQRQALPGPDRGAAAGRRPGRRRSRLLELPLLRLADRPPVLVRDPRAVHEARPVDTVLTRTATVRDRIVQVGPYRSNPRAHPVRLVEVQVTGPGGAT